jgi:hypothetical protein
MDSSKEEGNYQALIDQEKNPTGIKKINSIDLNDNDEKVIENDHENAIEKTPLESNKQRKCFFIELNPGFSYFNLSCYYLVQFGYVMAFTFIDACQDHLLESQDYDYKIKHEETGTINGNILLFDTLYLVIF